MVQLDKTAIITASENKILVLSDIIFMARDLSKVEEEVWRASKINIGLQALAQTEDYTSVEAQQKILLTLNKLSSIYNQQSS